MLHWDTQLVQQNTSGTNSMAKQRMSEHTQRTQLDPKDKIFMPPLQRYQKIKLKPIFIFMNLICTWVW